MRTISDDRGAPQPVTGTANSKVALKAMLQAAVMNTGGVPLNGVVIGPPELKAAPRPPHAIPEALNTRASPALPPIKGMTVIATPSDVSISAPSKLVEKIDMPTADEAARAIVAAAIETNENPLDVASEPRLRCRHYAMHALVKVFPSASKTSCARMVGAPGKRADKFWENSVQNVAKPIMGSSRRKAEWWNEAAFERVVAAISPGGTSAA